MAVSEKALPLVYSVTILLFFALVAVGLRLHVRAVLLKNTGADDWFCLAAICLSVATYIANMIAVAIGFGDPFPSLTPEAGIRINQAMWVSPALWGLSTALVKMSIVASYTRIWSTKGVLLLCRTLLAALTVFGLTLFFGEIFECVPIKLSWGVLDGDGHCIDKTMFMFVTSSLNIAFDLLIFAIPVPLIRKLQIAKQQRIALTVVFTIGAVACVASVMRLVSIYRLSTAHDPSTAGVNLGVWSGVESNLSIICACLPTLRPMLTRVFPKLLATVAGSTARKTRTFDDQGTYRMQALRSHDGGPRHAPAIERKYADPEAARAVPVTDVSGDGRWEEYNEKTSGTFANGHETDRFIRFSETSSSTLVTPPCVMVLPKNFSHPRFEERS
ncbi:Uu.00g088260.m01.CDS01 [Anthostomella pinea]|uniref:Uu.00g088260.m01.CDS01 n=1 Tax=Anthostomella pinea TaxID=933095 RepID=A0AAI8VMH6_9PEZI|nr:Uu.00g088260.m01.CDS01 [Anthostomella pinea]